jgi:hypothetical protein
MAQDTEINDTKLPPQRREHVSAARIYTQVPISASDTRPREKESLDNIVGRTPTWRHPPGFVEWLGAKLAIGVLIAIGVMVIGFVGAWWYTLPTFTEVKAALGASSAPAEQVIETFKTLREAHSVQVREFFQLVVTTTLVPLFTLLIGYAFGRQQRENGNNK